MASAKCVYCIIKFRKKQIPHTTKEVNRSRTQRTARTCRRRSALSKNTSAFVRFRCAFAAFIYCFLCGCVRARVAYLCWSWVEFFSYILHQHRGRTFAALNCAASPTDFFSFFAACILPFLFLMVLCFIVGFLRALESAITSWRNFGTRAVSAWHLAKWLGFLPHCSANLCVQPTRRMSNFRWRQSICTHNVSFP